jgi:glycosyltransferase involved in cell wall biosynthesis
LLIVIGAMDLGGAESHLAQVLPRLVEEGFEIAVHTLTGRGVLAGVLEAGGVRVVAPPGSAAGAKRGGFAWRAFRAARAGVSLDRFMRDWKPDIVNFFLPEAYLVGAPIALASSSAKLVMSRRSLNHYQIKHPLLARLERSLHGRMDALLGNSEAVAVQLIAEGAPRARAHMIRNGVDLTRFESPKPRDATRAGIGTAQDAVVVVCVANLIPYKGHADLIDALREMREAPDWELWCVGRDDGIGAELRARAAAAGIAGRVRFLGARSDVPDLLAAADIFALASHEEGSPNAVLEAMSARLPVVATNVGGIPEAVAADKTGLLVDARDPAALAGALQRLVADANARAAMGRAARERVEAHFSLGACVRAYAALYRRL